MRLSSLCCCRFRSVTGLALVAASPLLATLADCRCFRIEFSQNSFSAHPFNAATLFWFLHYILYEFLHDFNLFVVDSVIEQHWHRTMFSLAGLGPSRGCQWAWFGPTRHDQNRSGLLQCSSRSRFTTGTYSWGVWQARQSVTDDFVSRVKFCDNIWPRVPIIKTYPVR